MQPFCCYRPPGVGPEYATNKPLPPPKAPAPPQSYKPVPPPKPKNYRPPQPQGWSPAPTQGAPLAASNNNVYSHTKSYSMAENNNYPTHLHNGVSFQLTYNHNHGSFLSLNQYP